MESYCLFFPIAGLIFRKSLLNFKSDRIEKKSVSTYCSYNSQSYAYIDQSDSKVIFL